MLDQDDYPTEEFLKSIEEFDDYKNLETLFAEIKKAWAYAGYFSDPLDEPPDEVKPLLFGERHCKWLRLATGGWSGNESIIAALEKNPIVQAFCWYMSARGGLHIYQLPLWK